jgi:hypothetical protein
MCSAWVSLTRQKIFITKGWVGKPKGLLQVLWEQGWIDESHCKKSTNKEGYKVLNTSCYTLNGKKNPITGNLDESISLRHAIDIAVPGISTRNKSGDAHAKVSLQFCRQRD